jgi:Skp family chaperone for outer membrane proteins
VEKVFNNSDLFKQNSDELQRYQYDRQQVLAFINDNLPMSPQDAGKLADLMLKKNASGEEKNQTDKIKSDAATQVAEFRRLAQLKTQTPDEQAKFGALSDNARANKGYLGKLDAQYTTEVNAEKVRLQTEALDKVRKTIRGIAGKQGYTMVFSTDAAPYAANDITEESLKEVNKS